MKKLKTLLFAGAFALVVCFAFAGCGELDSGFLQVYGFSNQEVEKSDVNLELVLDYENMTYTADFDIENLNKNGSTSGDFRYDKQNQKVVLLANGVEFTFDVDDQEKLTFNTIFGMQISFEGQKNGNIVVYKGTYQTPALKENLINIKVGLNDERGFGQIAIKLDEMGKLGYTFDFTYKIDGNNLILEYNNKVLPGIDLPNIIVKTDDAIMMQAFGRTIKLERI